MSSRIAPTRSRSACAFSAAAAAGRLRLQRCEVCDRVCYPAREACPACWSSDLEWVEIPGMGRLLADTTLHNSFNPYFRGLLPWRIGTVQLAKGPTVLAHLHEAVGAGSPVRVIARTDMSGQGVLIALPEQQELNMMDDRQLRTLTCDPRGRTVLVTDTGNAIGRTVAEALAQSGAAPVYGGTGTVETGVPPDSSGESPAITPVPLDPSDPSSPAQLATAIGAALDIVVCTACLVRRGSALTAGGEAEAKQEMAANYFDLLRLVKAFGPALRNRGAHEDGALRAWVNVLSIHALAGGSGFGTSAASQAAALSLGQSLRAELAGSGVKVIEILCGPLDDEWNAALPPPKVSAAQVAATIVGALQQGIERAAVGPVAEDILQRWEEGPTAFEREQLST